MVKYRPSGSLCSAGCLQLGVQSVFVPRSDVSLLLWILHSDRLIEQIMAMDR